MYRECGLNGFRWTEKTMSMMKASETDSCEVFLRNLPDHGIFDSECTFSDAEKLYAASFFGMEEPSPDWIVSPEELRNRVLKDFPAELLLLSPAEHELLLKLIFFSGKMKLINDDDIISAASLAARLWIITVSDSEEDIEIRLPKQLITTAVIVLSGDKYRECRDAINGIDDSVNRTLYLYGFMQVFGPMLHLKQSVSGIASCPEDRLLIRFFRASYNYTYSPDGIMLLLHPGLAAIDYSGSDFSTRKDAMVETDEDSLRAIIAELEPQEQPLYDQMSASLRGYVRPELSTEDAVEDLIMLAKQNVAFPEMKQVLSNLISGIPRQDMESTLRNIQERIPRWILLSTSRIQ